MGRSLEEKINEIATKIDLYDYYEGFICPETFKGSGIKPGGDYPEAVLVLMTILTGSRERATKRVEECLEKAEGWCETDPRSDYDRVLHELVSDQFCQIVRDLHRTLRSLLTIQRVGHSPGLAGFVSTHPVKARIILL